MRVLQLQLLTWGTATAAISSAVWLSSTDQDADLCCLASRAVGQTSGFELPAEPTRAGPAQPAAQAGSSAAAKTRLRN